MRTSETGFGFRVKRVGKRVSYHTKQREELLKYLRTIPHRHFTVREACRHFRQSGIEIGTTTVYRQLERLVEEELVHKYIIDENSSACFEYVGTESNGENGASVHCKCERCGRLIHLCCDELEEVESHLLRHHAFAVNPMRTVFYGLCEECRAGENRGNNQQGRERE